MESITREQRHRHGRWAGVLLVCLAATAAAAAQGGGTMKPVTNVVQDLRAVGLDVEIELRSSRDFPVRDEIVTLRIGRTEFTKSRSPDDGRLNTLIFILTADEFEQATDGQTMTVQYGKGRTDGPRWNFGRLKKSSVRR